MYGILKSQIFILFKNFKNHLIKCTYYIQPTSCASRSALVVPGDKKILQPELSEHIDKLLSDILIFDIHQ